MFSTLRDAYAALQNTVVFLGQVPVYVVEVVDNPMPHPPAYPYAIRYIQMDSMQEYYNRGRAEVLVAPLDHNVRWDSFKLGYIQLGKTVGYASRIPNRQWKRGLSKSNVHVARLGDRGMAGISWFGVPLKRTLLNQYPSFDDAVKLLMEMNEDNEDDLNSSVVAFSRQLAVRFDELGQFKLLLKGEPVAYGDDKNAFKLGVNHYYLKEMLKYNGVKLNV